MNSDRNSLTPGWWILPAAVLGLAMWCGAAALVTQWAGVR